MLGAATLRPDWEDRALSSVGRKKKNGRVRGIVTGATLRRIVGRAMAAQFAAKFAAATAPFQFALQTRAGTDAVGHVLRAMTDASEDVVVLSLDGIGAFDHIKRAAILTKLSQCQGLQELLPYVRLFYARQSKHLWTDDEGNTHEILQGEGGEQGDPLMPALFALGQHDALAAASANLAPGERLLAFLDDLYVTTTRARARTAFETVSGEVQRRAGVQTHLGKLRAWSRGGGPAPEGLAALGAEVWTADLPEDLNGMKVLGAPLGLPAYIQAHGAERMREERRLLHKIPQLADPQCAWLLLVLSASPRANHLLRVLPPSAVARYAAEHDDAIWETYCTLMGAPERAGDAYARAVATMPARLGGLGLRSASRTSPAAYAAAWADALPVLRERLPEVAASLVVELERGAAAGADCLVEASAAAERIVLEGCQVFPAWREAAAGRRPPQLDANDADVGEWQHGWQYHASSACEAFYLERSVMASATTSQNAMLLSQSGPAAGRWLTALPTSPATTLPPARMQVAMRRRLRWPLPMGPQQCNGRSCRQPLDELGDHWTSCPRSGRLRRRAGPLERTWARVFREAGARVGENVFLRDTNLPDIRADDGRRLEVVATGLPLTRGVPLGCDCTMVSPLHANGSPWAGADTRGGTAIERGERDKARTYHELVNSDRLLLITLACEVGGRWSDTCRNTIRQLAAAKARAAPQHLRRSAQLAWSSRWWAMLSVSAQGALAAAILDDAVSVLDGHDGQEPALTDVLLDGGGAPASSRLPAR